VKPADVSLLNIPTLPLASGAGLPQVGLGLWKIAPADAPSAVADAIAQGYRHLDSACDYGNEHAVGQGISEAINQGLCTRDDLWITSKLWNTYHRPEHVKPALQRTLTDLGVDTLDLYLIHFPIALKYVPFDTRYPPEWVHDPDAAQPVMIEDSTPLIDTWRALEELHADGLIKHIGVCNFNVALLRDLVNSARVKPAVLQIESHPYLQQEKLLRYCDNNQIAVTAFSPLGSSSYVELGMAGVDDSILGHAVIADIAQRVQRTAAQVVLRWAVQRGTAVIPKTTRPERLIENARLFDFSLSADDMAAIGQLDRNQRFNDPGVFCELAFNTFFPIYE